MNTITERELADSAQNGALTCIKVVRSPDPDDVGWCVFATVNWKKGDHLLITQRRKPRIWRSTDRLLKHIEVNYCEIDRLAIFFGGEKDEQSTQAGGEGSAKTP